MTRTSNSMKIKVLAQVVKTKSRTMKNPLPPSPMMMMMKKNLKKGNLNLTQKIMKELCSCKVTCSAMYKTGLTFHQAGYYWTVSPW